MTSDLLKRFCCIILQLLASYIGEFQSHRQFPTLTEKFLLIPYVTEKVDPKAHPQLVVRQPDNVTLNHTAKCIHHIMRYAELVNLRTWVLLFKMRLSPIQDLTGGYHELRMLS